MEEYGMTELAREVLRLEAIVEIQNLMGAYSFLLDGRKYDEVLSLFAKNQVDVRVEMTNGVYQGYDSLVRLYPGKHYDQHVGRSYPGYEGRGNVAKHPQNTPLVVVGEDLKTAKGSWISMGFASFPREGQREMHWGMFRYGADFICEDGNWRIWHLHVYSGFMADSDRAWSDPRPMPENGPPPRSEPEEFQPDFPPTTTYDYSPELSAPYLPEVPEPYTQFDTRNAN
jgi:hypothetical protein